MLKLYSLFGIKNLLLTTKMMTFCIEVHTIYLLLIDINSQRILLQHIDQSKMALGNVARKWPRRQQPQQLVLGNGARMWPRPRIPPKTGLSKPKSSLRKARVMILIQIIWQVVCTVQAVSPQLS